LVPTYFQESISPAITPPKIPALLFLFRHMQGISILFRQQILLHVLQCISKRKSVCVSVCLKTCLSVHLSVRLYIFLSVYFSVCLGIFCLLFLYLCVCLSGYLSICISVCLPLFSWDWKEVKPETPWIDWVVTSHSAQTILRSPHC
jgi:hypothetical protein